MTSIARRDAVVELMHTGQSSLVMLFERLDGAAQFRTETWERPGGGGGTARVLSEGIVFERAGVNVSAVYGKQVPETIWHKHPASREQSFFATGISMVLHPRNPYVPAFHANFRYFEAGSEWWFGGGMDMTPCYGFEEDTVHFHTTLKILCDNHTPADYATFKANCDSYFYIKHRHEMRGVGGICFDNLHPDEADGWKRAFAFVQEGIETIQTAYVPVVQRRMHMAYGERERSWQLYRRGRYVEFNLVYDEGTLFGLQTEGDIEAILMSLPPLVRWEFHYQPEPGSAEAALADFLQPREWVVP